MNIFYKFLALSLAIFLLGGCGQDESLVIIDPVEELAFEIERRNSYSDFSSKVKKYELISRSSSWRETSEGNIELIREVMFEVELENKDKIDFGFWFRKEETNRDLLILEDENLDWKERNWDYKEFEDEVFSFYENYNEARILLDEKEMLLYRSQRNFEILKVKKALVDSKEKTYLYAYFSAIKITSNSVNYRIENGGFRGVIE